MKLKDKVALVIGVGTGIGERHRGCMVKEGASIVICDSKQDMLTKATEMHFASDETGVGQIKRRLGLLAGSSYGKEKN